MVRPIIAAFILIAAFGINSANAQQLAAFKSFSAFRDLAPGIDFFASNRQVVTPYEKPAGETIAKLKRLLGASLPKGAIFICSTLEQKDAVYEPKVLKMGYGWTLTVVTAEVRSQEMLARIKAQMGGELPAEIMDRMRKMPPEMMANAEKQMVTSVSQQIAYAVIQSTFAKDLQFRSSRLDDMGKSPLPDWLDIGIAFYAGGSNNALTYLQQNMDQSFPLEDILSMARPFVASSSNQNGGGPGGSGGMPSCGGRGLGRFGGGSMGGGMAGPGGGSMRGPGGSSGGMPGGMQRTLPKDEQDRMLFDGQASTFFAYMLEKAGTDKMRELIDQVREGKESRDYIANPDVLGPDFGKIEADWAAWVKAQKAEEPIRPN